MKTFFDSKEILTWNMKFLNEIQNNQIYGVFYFHMNTNFSISHLTYSHLLMSPLFASSANFAIKNSNFFRSFSPILFLTFSLSISSLSTEFKHFMKPPLIFEKNYDYFECNEFNTMITSSTNVFIRHCVFTNCPQFLSMSTGILNIELSTFKDSGGGDLNGIQMNNENSIISISNCTFENDHFENIFYCNNFNIFNLKYSIVQNTRCNSIFKIASNHNYQFTTAFCNFLNINEAVDDLNEPFIFSGIQEVTIENSFFQNVKYVMPYEETPKGKISNANLINCILNGQAPEGITNSFITNGTPIPIHSIQTGSCTPINTLPFSLLTTFIVLPTPTLSESPTSLFTETPTKYETSLNIYTDAQASTNIMDTSISTPISTSIPDSISDLSSALSPILNSTSVLTPEKTLEPTQTPVSTSTPSASPSRTSTPSASASQTSTPSASPSRTSTPSASPFPTNTPKATANVPLILQITIPVICGLIVIPIILYFCIRKIQDILSDDEYDFGIVLHFHTDANESETTSNRSDQLNVLSESSLNTSSDDELDIFGERPFRQDIYFNSENQNIEFSNSSSL